MPDSRCGAFSASGRIMRSMPAKWDPIRTVQRHFFSASRPMPWLRPARRLPFPSKTAELHHEVELVIALGAGGADVKPVDAPAMIFGHAVGIDLTRRDLQSQAKKAGRPWDMSKGFDRSAPVGPLTQGLPPSQGAISLTVDGRVRQSGDLRDMIWGVAEIIAQPVELCGGRRGGFDFYRYSGRSRSHSARRTRAREHCRRRAHRSDVRINHRLRPKAVAQTDTMKFSPQYRNNKNALFGTEDECRHAVGSAAAVDAAGGPGGR